MKTFVHDMDVREEGQLQMLLELYREGTIPLDVIKAKTGKSDAQIEEALANQV